jgi:hypothetical protein
MRALSLALLALATFPSAFATAKAADFESVPATEAEAIRQVVQMIREQVEGAAKKEGHAFRDAHRKHHGCVRASFEVLGGLPASLKQGIFAQPRSYRAWIRYSNGSGQEKTDHEGDGRGMAVKLLGVKGKRNLSESDDEMSSQDFVMINHPVFFVRNAEDYVGFQQAVQAGNVLWWLLNPKRVFHEGMIARAIQGKTMVNPLESDYFSMTASKLGSEQMKFRATPCAGIQLENPSDSLNRLRENLDASLAARNACFLFQVQLRKGDMPVEDPTIEWSEKESPFVTVAQISIPKQKPEQGEACEALSFNPWNGLAEHRPLGGISRARKEVYQAISRLRHDFNRQRREEPAQ